MRRSAVLATLALAACKPGEPRASLESIQPKSGGELALVPGGEFVMGDPKGRPDESPHKVSVSPFYIDRTPVTQELFEKVMGRNPSKRRGRRNPVERMQWTEAALFLNACSEIDGLTPCYRPDTWECEFEANGYRLPTEAEWEYACRAGGASRYFFGNDPGEIERYAWCKPHSKGTPRPVGEKLPNTWGLYDMHGNVWQWCNDWYGENYYRKSPPADPNGPASGKERVLRGGAWDSDPEKCRAAYRLKEFPVFSDACFGADSYGFRRVRRPSGSAVGKLASSRPKPEPPLAEKPSIAPPAASSDVDVSKLRGTIAFVSDRGGSLAIWRMRASGKDPKLLTKDPNPAADPRFSPDGASILFTKLVEGFPQVWRMGRDGSRAEMVTKGSQGSWSPDGTSIIFIRDNQTFVREFASGRERRVTPEQWERCGVPAFSPGGKEFAVASRHLGDIGIFLLGLDGAVIRQLKTEEPSCTPNWSKDGKLIIFQTVKGHIHQINSDGTNLDQLTFGADVQHDARFSPDGSMIVFCRAPSPEGPWQIHVARFGDDKSAPLTSEGSNSLPDWDARED